jgi:pimeloyl-ACP methyl ester carboxylesterase
MSTTIREIDANGFTFRVREAGTSGEPVILLHGFPETSHMWSDLMPRMESAGYRCLAPDQRGYSPGARPDGVEHYRYEDLTGDVIALANAWGADRFHLVGHDWGSLVGWSMVDRFPERVASWTSLSIPHPKAFASAVRDDPEEEPYRQLLQLFVTPGSETIAVANDAAMLRAAWKSSSPEEVAEYVSVLTQPGAMLGALNYYRASRAHKRLLEEGDPLTFGPVTTPTLFLWGKLDDYVRAMSVERGHEYIKGPYRFVEVECGHWMAQDKPAEIATEILAHLRANPIA